MGNPQHLEWLLEGVEAWNARRETTPFVPDLSGMGIRAAFAGQAKITTHGYVNLSNINFSEADLSSSNLSRCWVKGANLRGAKLYGAVLKETNFKGAFTRGASIRSTRRATTDLSQSTGLTQNQLNAMIGDRRTRIPDKFAYPARWLTQDGLMNDPIEAATSSYTDLNVSTSEPRSKLLRHVRFLLSEPLATAGAAEHIAASLRKALLEHPHVRDTNERSESEEILAALATSFEQLGAEFRARSDASALNEHEIARLSGIVEAQRAEIERLTSLLAKSDSSGKAILIAAAGGVAAAGVIAGVGYLFGHGGAQIISNIWDAFAPQSAPVAPALIPFDRV